MSYTETKLDRYPRCDLCGKPARYDFATTHGVWAYGCQTCYEQFRLYPDLGMGKGQKLVLKKQVRGAKS